ncbi:MAG: hypothetical protein ACI94Y_004322 [Maribacter sp.]|jgi:hypothetical protein
MKTLLIATLSLISTFTFVQVTWEGGTPSNEKSWSEPRNWSTSYVPDEFSDVLIPNVSSTTFSNPIIKEGVFEVNTIRIESNANLTIKASAKLMIHFSEGCYFNVEIIQEEELNEVGKMAKIGN